MARSDQKSLRLGWGVTSLVLSLGLVAGGIVAFVLNVPSHVYPVLLQWAGSAGVAKAVVHGHAGAYRTGLYWDFALIVGYTAGLTLACYLGRKVFWTAGFLRWALVGYFAAGVAALTNVIQDVLLIIALGSKPLAGDWIYRVASGASFIKFTSLLVVVPIGLLALANAFSRLVTHRGFMKRWARAQKDFPQTAESPWIIPPPPIESAGANESTSENWGLGRKIRLDTSIGRGWWSTGDRSSAPVHFTEDSQSPAVRGEQTAICLSGGGIRSASVALGALQSMRTELGGLDGIDRIVSVSGGGYTNGGMQLALTSKWDDKSGRVDESGRTEAQPNDVFSPGSVEEDHLRRHSSYLSDGLAQWLVALGVLFRNLLASFLIIGLSIATVGLAIGFFYRNVPIVDGGLQTLRTRLLAGAGTNAPGYPSVPWGVTLGIAAMFVFVLLVYVAELVWWSFRGSRPAVMARVTAGVAIAALLLVVVGVVVPAVVWLSSVLTWHLGISSKPMVAVTGVSAALSYGAVLAAALWRKKQVVSTALTDVKKGEKAVSGVLPNSMVQRILIWIALLALFVVGIVIASWVATSGLDKSWWAFLVVGPLLFLAIFLDQTSMSLHPFYRRRLASAFAVRRQKFGANGQRNAGEIAEAVPYSYDEATSLSRYGGQRHPWPGVTFAASANLTGQSRTPPGRRAVSYALRSDYVGGPQVGWVRTDVLEGLVSNVVGKDLTVEAAVAISGAAIASAMGAQTRDYEVFLALTNVRLGAWLPNPRFLALKCANWADWTVPGLPRIRGLSYFAREILGIHSDHSRLLLCTDGGHYDNLGLVETLRHRYQYIYCFDASGATQPMADTLAGALMLAREELGVEIVLDDPEALSAGSGTAFDPAQQFSKLNTRLSKSAVISGTITYPPIGEQGEMTGRLIFAQTDLTHELPYDLLEYTQDDPGFPNDGTADQWFDCNRFDAYKTLGAYLGLQAAQTMRNLNGSNPIPPGGSGAGARGSAGAAPPAGNGGGGNGGAPPAVEETGGAATPNRPPGAAGTAVPGAASAWTEMRHEAIATESRSDLQAESPINGGATASASQARVQTADSGASPDQRREGLWALTEGNTRWLVPLIVVVATAFLAALAVILILLPGWVANGNAESTWYPAEAVAIGIVAILIAVAAAGFTLPTFIVWRQQLNGARPDVTLVYVQDKKEFPVREEVAPGSTQIRLGRPRREHQLARRPISCRARWHETAPRRRPGQRVHCRARADDTHERSATQRCMDRRRCRSLSVARRPLCLGRRRHEWLPAPDSSVSYWRRITFAL